MIGNTIRQWDSCFIHQGRAYKIYKRTDSDDAPFYLQFMHEGRRFTPNLGTNDVSPALARAQAFIDEKIPDRWKDSDLQATRRSLTLDKLIDAYLSSTRIASRSMRNNVLALRKMLERVHGVRRPTSEIQLSALTKCLVTEYQEVMELTSARAAGTDPILQRQARERALRTSRSVIRQARSLFTRRAENDVVSRYEALGISLPLCIEEFMRVRLRGRARKVEYNAPSDHVVQIAFEKIVTLREDDPDLFKAFWLASGAGLRRREIHQCKWESFIARDGRYWISGGFGKDGQRIEVPLQKRAVDHLLPLKKDDGWIVSDRGEQWAKRLSGWLRKHGWSDTQKTIHELRAYVGSLIYRNDPMAAMRFLRHKSISITEKFYVRYGVSAIPADVL